MSPRYRFGVCVEHLSMMPTSGDADDNKFIRFTQLRVEKPKTDDESSKEPTPKKLAIGLPGGFNVVRSILTKRFKLFIE